MTTWNTFVSQRQNIVPCTREGRVCHPKPIPPLGSSLVNLIRLVKVAAIEASTWDTAVEVMVLVVVGMGMVIDGVNLRAITAANEATLNKTTRHLVGAHEVT